MHMIRKTLFYEDDVIEISYTSRIYKKRNKFFEVFILEVYFKISKLFSSNINRKKFPKLRIDSKHIKWFNCMYQILLKLYKKIKTAGLWNDFGQFICLIYKNFNKISNNQYPDSTFSTKVYAQHIFDKQGFTQHFII